MGFRLWWPSLGEVSGAEVRGLSGNLCPGFQTLWGVLRPRSVGLQAPETPRAAVTNAHQRGGSQSCGCVISGSRRSGVPTGRPRGVCGAAFSPGGSGESLSLVFQRLETPHSVTAGPFVPCLPSQWVLLGRRHSDPVFASSSRSEEPVVPLAFVSHAVLGAHVQASTNRNWGCWMDGDSLFQFGGTALQIRSEAAPPCIPTTGPRGSRSSTALPHLLLFDYYV